MGIFDEVLNLRDIGLGYLPPELEARCRARIDAEIRAHREAHTASASRGPQAARSATPGDAFSTALG
eukprot:13807441-Heterocapsa_arctica.AAC.1